MAEPIQVGEAPKKNRRAFIMLGVAVGLFLMLRVLPGLLFGGGDDAGEVGQVNLPPSSGVTTPTTAPGDGGPVAETVASFSDKNPFRPLVSTVSVGEVDAPAPPPEVIVTDPIAPFPGETVDPGADPVTVDPAPSDGGADPGETPTTTAPPRQPDRVALLEIFTTPEGAAAAAVRINDTVYRVPVGQDFAGRYRVLSIDQSTRCAQLLFGDERFGLCEGDETLK